MNDQIVIVGVGALGSHVALFTRNLDWPTKIIDFDRIEQKNVLSQFHTKMGVGKNKAQALQQAMRGMFGVPIEIAPFKLAEDNAAQLLGDHKSTSLIVDCLDNATTRKIVKLHSNRHGIPVLHCALAAGGNFGRLVWNEHDFVIDEGLEGADTCEDGEQLPFIAAMSAMAAVAIQDFLGSGTMRSYQMSPNSLIPLHITSEDR